MVLDGVVAPLDVSDAELLAAHGLTPTFRVCVCGSRVWGEDTDRDGRPRSAVHVQVEHRIMGKLLPRLIETHPTEELVLVVGGARGADTMAETVGRLLHQRIERYDADWDGDGRAAGPLRNARMLATGLDLVVALYAYGQRFDPGYARGGTNDMVRRSELAGVPVHAWAEGRWRSFDGVRWAT